MIYYSETFLHYILQPCSIRALKNIKEHKYRVYILQALVETQEIKVFNLQSGYFDLFQIFPKNKVLILKGVIKSINDKRNITLRTKFK